eukprot:14352413-Alexandrium_andersonii.AAC.1
MAAAAGAAGAAGGETGAGSCLQAVAMTGLDSSCLGRLGRARLRVSATALSLPPPPSAVNLQLTARM